ncbi:heterokaryon incompatibility protein-domain-containing protein [Biscogniauxia sp. FL1348]|nr:heterokaryon incompatibility protein-domain-containing protein [Biscogniauxia sp. FL1348]
MEEFKGKSPHRPFGNDTDIRIITLLPNSEFNAPIECQLEHVTLEPGVGYEAISYTWGDPKITEPIFLDGQSYPVTVNICTALRYLRLEDSPRRLWVDSICINQKDNYERSHQIPKMRDIYRLASQVLIWIGDYQPFTQSQVKRLFDFMIKMVTTSRFGKDAEMIATMGFDEIWRLQEQIHEFFTSRRWFTRMWVIQEVSVRKRLCRENLPETPVMVCGHLQLPLFYLDLSQDFWVMPGCESQLGLRQVCPTMKDLSLIWNNYREMVNYSLACTPGRQIAWILSLASELFQATDQRDFIYSVLGLLVTDEIPIPFRPDYNKPTMEVLTESATYIIESGTLDVIQFNSMQTKELPSWVPDWRFPNDYGAHVRVLNKSALEVDILPFTKIQIIGPKFDTTYTTLDAAQVWEEFFLDIEDIINGGIHQVTNHRSFGQAVSRMLDDNSWHMGAIKEEPTIFLTAGKSIRAHQQLNDTVERLFESEMWRSCSDNSIGIMGQPSVRPEEGDLICSIRGACAEFLVGICQRTVKCFGTTMNDILDDLETLWKTRKLWRTRIY